MDQDLPMTRVPVTCHVAPLTPNELDGQAMTHTLIEIHDDPVLPPITPRTTPDRRVIGLEQYLRMIGSPGSPLEFNGYEDNSNVDNQLVSDIGNSYVPSPPRSLLERFERSLDSDGDF